MRDDTPAQRPQAPDPFRSLATCDYIGASAKERLLRELISLSARNAAMAIASDAVTISATAFVIREKMTEVFGLPPSAIS